jgi:hypothetical protein
MLVPALTNPPMQPAWSDCARACPTVDRTVVFPCDERYLASGMISPEGKPGPLSSGRHKRFSKKD